VRSTPRFSSIRQFLVAACVSLVGVWGIGCTTTPIASAAIDWNATDHWSVHVVTQDADGDLRVARIWIVVIDGAGVIRTQQSRWWKNIQRGSFCRIRVDGRDFPVAVEEISDLAARRRVDQAFEEKYGWQERMVISEDRAATDDHYMRLTMRLTAASDSKLGASEFNTR
jgi:hypothetical protein